MKKILVIFISLISISNTMFAGNPDRRGEAGAWELNINGWARSTGLWGMNASRIRGLEAERVNVAGLAYVRGSEIGLSYSQWLWGSGVGVIQGGFAQSIKEKNVVALSINALNFGTMYKTTTDVPEGIGTFKPTFLNIGISYARDFGTGINGGLTVRIVNESIENISATGVAIDAGLQYVTGKHDNIHFGVAIRNIGTPMKFKGDGFNERVAFSNDGYQTTFDRRSNKFELPTQFMIAASYDFLFGKRRELDNGNKMFDFRITPNAQFTSNAFGSDHYFAGLEFSFKEIFQLRGGYRFETGIFKRETRINAYTGPSAGASFQIPFSKANTSSLGIDYSFRASQPYIGTHTFGLRVNIGSKKKEAVNDEVTSSMISSENSSRSSKSDSDDSSKKGKKKGKDAVVAVDSNKVRLDSIKLEMVKLQYELDEAKNKKPDTVVVTKTNVVTKVDTVYFGMETKVEEVNGRKVEKIKLDESVLFDSGKSTLKKESDRYMQLIASRLVANPSAKVFVTGHSDNVGNAAQNMELSKKRAEAAKASLVKFGANAAQITTQGFGSSQPVATNDTPQGRAQNRRVEMTIEY